MVGVVVLAMAANTFQVLTTGRHYFNKFAFNSFNGQNSRYFYSPRFINEDTGPQKE